MKLAMRPAPQRFSVSRDGMQVSVSPMSSEGGYLLDVIVRGHAMTMPVKLDDLHFVGAAIRVAADVFDSGEVIK